MRHLKELVKGQQCAKKLMVKAKELLERLQLEFSSRGKDRKDLASHLEHIFKQANRLFSFITAAEPNVSYLFQKSL